MKLIVSGSRNGHLSYKELLWLELQPPPDSGLGGVRLVITGGASGVDEDAHQWALKQGIQTAVFAANWRAFGPSAGPRRNSAMASIADGVALFPGGAGTASMKKAAKQRGLMIFEYVPKEDAE